MTHNEQQLLNWCHNEIRQLKAVTEDQEKRIAEITERLARRGVAPTTAVPVITLGAENISFGEESNVSN